MSVRPNIIIIIIIIIIIGIQPLDQAGQRPELSQATGMALVRCILGKFLGVVCHCFPLRVYIYIHTSPYLTLKSQKLSFHRAFLCFQLLPQQTAIFYYRTSE